MLVGGGRFCYASPCRNPPGKGTSVPHDTPDEPTIRRRLAEAGQEHVLRFWNDLSEAGRGRLLGQLAEIDFRLLGRLIGEHVTRAKPVELPANLEPTPFIPLPTTDAQRRRRRRMHDLGEQLLAAGKVAALVVAGGQGTRLNWPEPKGTYPIGPMGNRTLFGVFAAGILAARRAYGVPIPWYIMTSEATDGPTRDFFRAHDYLGLPSDDVRFFVQGMMGAVDFEGKLILASPDSLARNPNGHGGTLLGLATEGMLTDMRRRGIEHISYFQADNPLVPPLDPVFIGHHADAASDMSSKMVRKRDAREKVGVFCTSGRRLHVIEYSDLPDDLATQTDGDHLRFGAGSIAIHILSRAFVERLTAGEQAALPFHRAVKRIPCVNESGATVEPAEPNGVKFEMFIFDALPHAANPVVLEIDRAREFSPVKNADGDDSPATARRDLVALDAARIEEAGLRVPRNPQGQPTVKVQISPLAARTADDLKALLRRRGITAVTCDLALEPGDE